MFRFGVILSDTALQLHYLIANKQKECQKLTILIIFRSKGNSLSYIKQTLRVKQL